MEILPYKYVKIKKLFIAPLPTPQLLAFSDH